MTQLTAKPFTARPLTARPFTAYPFGESTSVSNPLVWHAAYPDADGVMQAQLIGSGTPTFNVDDGLLLPDHEGIYRTTAEDTPPWHGARKVTNLLSYSEDLSNAAWVKFTTTAATEYADGWLISNLDDAAGDRFAQTPVTTGAQSKKYVFSIYLKGDGSDIGKQVQVALKRTTGAFSYTAFNYTLTSDYVRVTVSLQMAADNPGVQAILGNPNNGSQAASVVAKWPQLEDVTGQANQNPSEYVPTTSAAASKYFSYENGNTVV